MAKRGWTPSLFKRVTSICTEYFSGLSLRVCFADERAGKIGEHSVAAILCCRIICFYKTQWFPQQTPV